jgi:DNA topoisomerase VI subunit B
MEVIEHIVNEDRGTKRHKKYEKEDEDLIEKVASEQVTDVILRDCLTQHVEQVLI